MTPLTLWGFILFNIVVYIVTISASLYNLNFCKKRTEVKKVLFRILFTLSFVPFVNLGVLLFTLVKIRQIYDITHELNILLTDKKENENE